MKPHKEYMKNWRARDPERAAFQNLKAHAKARGKQFNLTLEQFRQWCAETNYIQLKGRYKHNLHIDRIRSEQGYSLGNIQILTATENCTKALSERFKPFSPWQNT